MSNQMKTGWEEYDNISEHFRYIKEHPDEWLSAQSSARRASLERKQRGEERADSEFWKPTEKEIAERIGRGNYEPLGGQHLPCPVCSGRDTQYFNGDWWICLTCALSFTITQSFLAFDPEKRKEAEMKVGMEARAKAVVDGVLARILGAIK